VSDKALLPWQRESWQRLVDLVAAQRLPHALLLSGPPGTGKRQFAAALAALLLCARPGAAACGQCRSCHLLAAGSHPDELVVEPEEEGRQIRVEAVRKLVGFAVQTPSLGRRKVIRLAAAERLNHHAVNALLKSLEEPPPGTHVILVSDQAGVLPATLRSRCQQLHFPLPPRAEAEQWLEPWAEDSAVLAEALAEAGGRPLQARALLEQSRLELRRQWRRQLKELLTGESHAVAVAEQWQAQPLGEVLGWLEQRLALAIRQALVPAADADELTRLLAERGAAALLRWRDRVLERRQQWLSGLHFSQPLMLEDLLL